MLSSRGASPDSHSCHRLQTISASTFQNVGLTEHCDGREGHPLIAAIKALKQKFEHRPVDGRVSPAKGVLYTHHYDQYAYLIFRLNVAALPPELRKPLCGRRNYVPRTMLIDINI
jgi:hypothetical protein